MALGSFFCSEMQISGFVQLPGQNQTFQRLLCAQCLGSGVAVPGKGDPSGSLWIPLEGEQREEQGGCESSGLCSSLQHRKSGNLLLC